MSIKKKLQRNRYLNHIMEKFVISKHKQYVVKQISTKRFSGSKLSSFYDKAYYENGTKSNYGRLDKQRNKYFFPHQEQYYLPERMRKAQEIVQQFGIKRALCLGCGKGFFVKALRQCGVEAYGVDLSEYAIRHCPKDVQDYLYQGDICDLSFFKNGQFEMVTAVNVLEHIAIPDLYTAMNEIVRVSQCYVLICVKISKETNLNAPLTLLSSDQSHCSIYSKEWWKEEFNNRSLQILFEECDIYPDGTEGIVFYYTKHK